MKNFCVNLKEHATRIINYEKKEMIPLTKNKIKYILSKKFVIYTKKDLVPMMTKKMYFKVKDHCHYTGKYRGAVHDICNLRYKIAKEEFEGQFECLGGKYRKIYDFFSTK